MGDGKNTEQDLQPYGSGRELHHAQPQHSQWVTQPPSEMKPGVWLKYMATRYGPIGMLAGFSVFAVVFIYWDMSNVNRALTRELLDQAKTTTELTQVIDSNTIAMKAMEQALGKTTEAVTDFRRTIRDVE